MVGEPAPFVAVLHRKSPRVRLLGAFVAGLMVGALVSALAILGAVLVGLGGP